MIDLLIKCLQELGYTARYEPYGDKYKVVINEGLAKQYAVEVNANVSELTINDFADWVDMSIKTKVQS